MAVKNKSQRMSSLAQSDIRQMTEECRKLGGINMGQGLCQLPIPQAILDRATKAFQRSDENIYSPAGGVPELRKQIAKKIKKVNGIEVDSENEIVVTVGATGAYAAALMSLLDPGDGIMLFEPYYGYHWNTALLAQIQPQAVTTSEPYVEITSDLIEAAVKPNTKAILICTPANPSGKMWSEKEILAVGKVAEKHNLLILTDEMYEYFRYEGREHISPASIPTLRQRTVTMMGLSKTFSITGWRLGYVAAPAALAEPIRLANDYFYVCAPTPLQHAVTAGFDLLDDHFVKMQQDFTIRRDLLCEALEKGGFKPLVPHGAYYVLADISRFGYPSAREFSMDLLRKTKVAGVSGESFFQSAQGKRYVRFNFAMEKDLLNEACERLSKTKEAF